MTRASDAWLELHVGLAGHPKTIRLQLALDLSEATAIGHLVLLWTWALQYATNGSLRRFTDAEIAKAARYDARTGTAAAFVQALVSSGWLDAKPRRLHDWSLYAGRLLDQRARNRERMQRARAANVHTRAPLPDQTVQDLTGPDLTGPDQRQNGVPPGAVDLAAKYLTKLRAESPRTFAGFTPAVLFEIAADEGVEPMHAARMLGDVTDWWLAAPASKRWKRPTRGWRSWCRREIERRDANGQASVPAPEPAEDVCPSCFVPTRLGLHAEDCPVVLARA
jgi:hypothetical protein